MNAVLKILMIVLICFSTGLNAQNTPNKIREYKIWITKIDQTKVKGILYFADDKGINIVTSKAINDSNMRFVEAKNIDEIKIRRRGKIGTGLWVGALSGFAIGGLIGLASGDEPDKTVDGGWLFGTYTVEGTSAGTKALGYGVISIIPGSGVGAIIASKKYKISINGNFETYKTQLNRIKSYSINYK